MAFKNLTLFALAIILLFNSCKKNTQTPTPVATVTDVYVAGYKTVNNQPVATYWKNGAEIGLTNTPNSSANGIAIVGTDVYVVGYSNNNAVYWKNGAMNYLTTTVGSAAAIVVDGSDIYIAGFHAINGFDVAAYWKNGTEVDLPSGTKKAELFDIKVKNGNVIAAGYISNANLNPIATYWSNGVASALSDDTTSPSYGLSIISLGTDIYVAGNYDYELVYWKNGTTIQLAFNSIGITPTSIGTLNGDIYVVGNYGSVAAYWKNGVLKKFAVGGTTDSNIVALTFQDSDVYMAGNFSGIATYWLNDNQKTLTTGISTSSEATSIAVVKHN